jgi:hypothetical protein
MLPENFSSDSYLWDVTVEWRGAERWAVMHGPMCLGSDGQWDVERQPSSRDDKWREHHRFALNDALRLGREWAAKIKINGLTPAGLLAKYGPEGLRVSR